MNQPAMTDQEMKKAAAHWGRLGGVSRSQRKVEAARRNFAIGRERKAVLALQTKGETTVHPV